MSYTPPVRTQEEVSLGIKDAKGRVIGFIIRRWEADHGADGQVKHCFFGDVHAARDGVRYGACQPDIRTDTVEAREKIIARKLHTGRRRYEKLF